MASPKELIENMLKDIRDKKAFNERDALFLISQLRVVLEGHNSQSSYPTLSLMANWCLHTQVSSSAKVFDILEKATKAINWKDGDSAENIVAQLDKLIDMGRFVLDVQEVLSRMGVLNPFDTDPYATLLCKYTLNIVSQKAITYPDYATLDITDRCKGIILKAKKSYLRAKNGAQQDEAGIRVAKDIWVYQLSGMSPVNEMEYVLAVKSFGDVSFITHIQPKQYLNRSTIYLLSQIT